MLKELGRLSGDARPGPVLDRLMRRIIPPKRGSEGPRYLPSITGSRQAAPASSRVQRQSLPAYLRGNPVPTFAQIGYSGRLLANLGLLIRRLSPPRVNSTAALRQVSRQRASSHTRSKELDLRVSCAEAGCKRYGTSTPIVTIPVRTTTCHVENPAAMAGSVPSAAQSL